MAVELELTIGFGADGNSHGFLDGGWARTEPEFTWAVGAESHLIRPSDKAGAEYVLMP
jgi:hypothetical protein